MAKFYEIFTVPIKRKIARAKYEVNLYENASKCLTEDTFVTDDWKDLRDLVLNLDKKELDEDNSKELRKQAIRFYYRNCHARGIISNYVNYIIGNGANIKPLDNNEDIIKYWDNFIENNKFKRKKQRELATRTYREGEFFLRLFGLGTEDVKARFIDPDKVEDVSKTYTHGIQTEPKDVETPINYYTKTSENEHDEIIPAKEIVHGTIFVDSNVKRGRSVLEVALPKFKKYDGWLEDRIVLNKIRASVALIKKIDGDSADLQTIVDNTKSTRNTTETNRTKVPKRGSIFTANPGVDYKFLSPQLDAKDVKEDGRNILLTIAVAMVMTESMITGDASNANYASSMVAESPVLKSFLAWQGEFEDFFKEIYATVMKSALEAGLIPEKYEVEIESIDEETGLRKTEKKTVDTTLKCSVEFNEIVKRDFKELVDGYSILKAEGILSDDTFADKFDLDIDEETKKQKIRDLKTRKSEEDRDKFDAAREKALKDEGEPANSGEVEKGEGGEEE